MMSSILISIEISPWRMRSLHYHRLMDAGHNFVEVWRERNRGSHHDKEYYANQFDHSSCRGIFSLTRNCLPRTKHRSGYHSERKGLSSKWHRSWISYNRVIKDVFCEFMKLNSRIEHFFRWKVLSKSIKPKRCDERKRKPKHHRWRMGKWIFQSFHANRNSCGKTRKICL